MKCSKCGCTGNCDQDYIDALKERIRELEATLAKLPRKEL